MGNVRRAALLLPDAIRTVNFSKSISSGFNRNISLGLSASSSMIVAIVLVGLKPCLTGVLGKLFALRVYCCGHQERTTNKR